MAKDKAEQYINATRKPKKDVVGDIIKPDEFYLSIYRIILDNFDYTSLSAYGLKISRDMMPQIKLCLSDNHKSEFVNIDGIDYLIFDKSIIETMNIVTLESFLPDSFIYFEGYAFKLLSEFAGIHESEIYQAKKAGYLSEATKKMSDPPENAYYQRKADEYTIVQVAFVLVHELFHFLLNRLKMTLKEKYHALTENFRRHLNEYFIGRDFDTSEFLGLIGQDHVMEECICDCHASCFVYTVFHDGFLSLNIQDIVKAIKLSIMSMQILSFLDTVFKGDMLVANTTNVAGYIREISLFVTDPMILLFEPELSVEKLSGHIGAVYESKINMKILEEVLTF